MSRIIKKIIKEHEDNFDVQGGSITEVSTVVIDGHEVEAWNPINQDPTHGQIGDDTTIPDHTGPTYNIDNGTTGGSGGDPVREYTYGETGIGPTDAVITVRRLYSEVIRDFSSEKLQEYQTAGGTPYAIMKDGTKVQVNWSDVRQVRSALAAPVGFNVAQLAAANNQNFWTDDDGAHVTSDVKDSWLEEYDEPNHGTLATPTLNNPWHNILINSLGILLRKGLVNLTSITDGAISFFDGTGNNSSNVTATFGSSGAQIGKTSENHVMLDSNGLSAYDGTGELIPMHASNIEADHASIGDLDAAFATICTAWIDSLDAGDIQTLNLSANDITALRASLARLEAGTVTAADLTAINGFIEDFSSLRITASNLDATYATIANLDAATGKFDNLSAVVLAAIDASIDNLTADEISATDLQALNAALTNLEAGTATVQDLTAINAFIDMLAANRITTNYLIANYADIGLANVNNAWIENGVIKTGAIGDAQIQGVSANKLTAGEINADEIIVRNLQASNLKVGRLNGQPVLGGYSYVSPKSSGYSSKNPKTEGWYELSGTTYVLTNDTTVNNSKKYYAADDYVALYDQDTIDDMFDDVNDRIDSAIETWTGTAVPTTSNYPASQWTTNALKQEHIGDIYYVVNAGNEADGYTYRYTYDNTQSSYKWTLIKDNQVTAALQRLVTAEGNISGLQTFQSETNTWISETDEGLTTIRENHTSLSAVVDKTIVNNEQLWYSKANTTAPAAPTAQVTSTSTAGNAWRLNVPAYNASYPNYFYCYQWTYADGTYGWSRVTRDIAMGEAQSQSRTALSTANGNIKSQIKLWFAKDNTTAPDPPTAQVTSTSTAGNAWRTVVPVYNESYPKYFYCYQYEKGDGTFAWSPVVYDAATTENQENARSALGGLSSKVDTTTFTTLVDEVGEQSTTITNLTTKVDSFQVGGRNLLRNTANPSTTNGVDVYGVRTSVIDGGIIRITSTSSGAYVAWNSSYLPYSDYGDEVYTFSCEARLANVTSSYTKNEIRLYIGVQPANRIGADILSSTYDGYVGVTNSNKLTSKWQMFSITIMIPDGLTTGLTDALVDDSCITVELGTASKSLPVDTRHWKLEKGTFATSWTPAPEDMATAEDITTITTTVNTISQTVDSNVARISSVETTTTNLRDEYPNQWKFERYSRSSRITAGSVIPTQDDYIPTNLIDIQYIHEDNFQQNLALGNTYIAKARVYVYITVAAQQEAQVCHDDSAALYLNNELIYSKNAVANTSTPGSVTLNLVVGWNKIEFLLNENSGSEYCYFLNMKPSEIPNCTKVQAELSAYDDTSMHQRVSEIVQDLDGFKTTVSSTYATSGSVTDLTTRIDNFQIGGRNLLRNTANPSGTNGVDVYRTRASIPETGIIRLTSTSSSPIAVWTCTYLPYSEYKNDTYTFSVEARLADVESTYTANKIQLYLAAMLESRIGTAAISSSYDRYGTLMFSNKLTSEWKKFSITLSVPDQLTSGQADALVDTSFLVAEVAASGSTLPFDTRHWKLEKGTFATSWTPAPEDMTSDEELTETANQLKAHYASSATGSSVAAKEATCNNFALYIGAQVSCTFTAANTAASPTLNVNGTGAKQIRSYSGAALVESEYKWAANSTLLFVYDGSYWRMHDAGITKRLTTAETNISQNSEAITLRATKTEMSQAIDDIQVGGRNLLRTEDITIYSGGAGTVTTTGYSATGTVLYSRPAAKHCGFHITNVSRQEVGQSYIVHFKIRETTATKVINKIYIFTDNGKLNGNTSNRADVYVDGVKLGSSDVDLNFDLTDGSIKQVDIYYTYDDVNTSTYTGIILQCLKNTASAYTIELTELKWETGTKVTGWSPAPEDMQTVAQAAAELSVTNQAISAKVSSTDYTGAKVTSLINQAADSVKIQAKHVEIDGTAIFNNNDFSTALAGALDDIQIGGRNLLRDTANPNPTNGTTLYWTRSSVPEAGVVRLTPTTSAANANWIVNYLPYSDYNDKTYTFSIEAKLADVDTSYTINKFTMYFGFMIESRVGTTSFGLSYDKYKGIAFTNKLTTSWQKFYVTFKVPDDLTTGTDDALVDTSQLCVQITLAGSAMPVDTRHWKLEQGTRATEWTQAPEDNEPTGLTIQWDCSTFNGKNGGEAYICRWDCSTQTALNQDAWVRFNGLKRTVTKAMLNPNGLAINKTVYIVVRLSSADAVSGTTYFVWYDGGWKNLDSLSYTASTSVISDWTWADATDMVIGSFLSTGSEVIRECITYDVPLHYNQLNVTGITAYESAASAQATANAAAPKTTAVKRQQRIYYRSSVSTTPTAPSTWVTETTAKYAANATTAANWTTKYSQLTSGSTKYPYMFTCLQSETVSGTITNSTVLLDDTTTVIDGGNIITGSVTANKLNASDINASNVLTVGAFATAEQAKILNENLSVGGRNLLLATATEKSVTLAEDATSAYTGSYARSVFLQSLEPTFTATTQVSISFDYTITGNTSATATIYAYIYNASAGGVVIDTPDSTETYSGQYIKTFALGSTRYTNISTQASSWTRMRFRIVAGTGGGTLTVSNAKFELGNMPTSWTPSPEDLQTQITTNNTNITNEINQRKAAYGTCSTAAATQEKAVTCTNFVLATGNSITVKFTTASTYAADVVKLNVNGTGAKNIWVSNAVTSATNQLRWGAGAYITFRYDGAEYVVVGEPRTWYGACAIAKATAAKTDASIVCAGAVICKGATVVLAMTYENTATAPTLNIASTGAVAIYTGSSDTRPTVANGTSWLAGTTVSLQFDGSAWRTGGLTYINGDHIITGTIDASKATITNINATNINTGAINASLITTGTLDASKATITKINASNITTGAINASLITTGTLDASLIGANAIEIGKLSTSFINSAVNWYATCSTAAATVAKVATITPATTDFSLTAGMRIAVKFTKTNSGAVDSLTLNVNNTGALSIKYTASGGGIADLPAKGYIQANMTYNFIYDGTYWVMQYNYNSDSATTYITSIDSNGIKVHASSNTTTNYIQVNASGLTVYTGGNQVATFGDTVLLGSTSSQGARVNTDGMQIFKGGNQVASFGDSVIIGKTTTGYAGIDYRSLKIYDKEGYCFADISDLRDSTGVASNIVDVFVGDGSTKSFTLEYAATNTDYYVTVSDGSGGTVTKTTTKVTFSTAPTKGTTITVTHNSNSRFLKAYNFGLDCSTFGALGMTIGYGCETIGLYSVAIGRACHSTNKCSYSEGYDCRSKGFASHAEGHGTTASGQGSHAEGSNTDATGDYSHAEGAGYGASASYHTKASGYASHAEGYYATASGQYSHAEGSKAVASGEASHAEGYAPSASGKYSHAQGYVTTASGDYSHASGDHTTAAYQSQFVIGIYNSNNSSNIFEIGNGTSSTKANAFRVTTSNTAYVGSTAVTSDERVKTDITELDPDVSYEFIKQLKPKSYKKFDRPELGFVAQDIEKLVYGDILVDESPNFGYEDFKNLSYEGLIAPLVSTVQTLQKENEELKQKNKELEDRLARLEELLLKDGDI